MDTTPTSSDTLIRYRPFGETFLESGAFFDGSYRYLLWRIWDAQLPRVLWILLNPSTADASQNDPTLRRLIGFSRSFGFGSLEVVNLFALCSSTPDALRGIIDAVGPDNDRYIQEALARTSTVIVAWGNRGTLANREKTVLSLIRKPISCLGTTFSGHPKHPLYVSASTPLCLYYT